MRWDRSRGQADVPQRGNSDVELLCVKKGPMIEGGSFHSLLCSVYRKTLVFPILWIPRLDAVLPICALYTFPAIEKATTTT